MKWLKRVRDRKLINSFPGRCRNRITAESYEGKFCDDGSVLNWVCGDGCTTP